MTDQPDDDDYLQLLVFSDNTSVREEVKNFVFFYLWFYFFLEKGVVHQRLVI